MTIENLPAWATGATFLGPTLLATLTDPFDGATPACATCPVGQWYRGDEKLRCFCTAFRTEMYGPLLPKVTQCDAKTYGLINGADV